MSAFLLTPEHISFLVDVGLHLGREEMTFRGRDGLLALTPATAQAVGEMLMAENVRSVSHLYSGEFEELPGPVDKTGIRDFEYRPTRVPIDPIVVAKQIRCYCYQTREFSNCPSRDAWAFCDALTTLAERAMPRELTRLVRSHYAIGSMVPAYLETEVYDDAPWGLDADDLDEMRASLEEAA